MRNIDLAEKLLELIRFDIKTQKIGQEEIAMKSKLVLTKTYKLLGKLCYD